MNILAPTLEFSILHALLNQDIAPADVDPKTLSQVGRILWDGMHKLGDYDVKGVLLYATEVASLDKGRLQEYMANVTKHASNNAFDIHKMLRERQLLLDISNEVQEQLNSGDLDLSKINTITATTGGGTSALESVEQQLVTGAPEEPAGPRLHSLPQISQVTNGVFGMWVIGGPPGIGKSTLSTQCGVDISASSGLKVLYYDAENGGRVTLHRIVKNFGLDTARKLGKNLFIRDSLRTLNKDLAIVKPPAVIMVDSIQKITTSGDDRRVGLDRWINRFEQLKKSEGYSVILVSEVPRDKYTGDPRLDMFKETGALEYAADSAFGLVERGGGFVAVHCVKNRHYEQKGQVALIERKKAFWFSEAPNG